MKALNQNKTSKIDELLGPVYFYCCPERTPYDQAYQHPLVCIAEGLRELGVPFYSNVDYWRISHDTDEMLFVHNSAITPDDCSVVVIDTEWFTWGNAMPHGLFHVGRRYTTIYIEIHDGMHSVGRDFRQFDYIFRGHYNRRFAYSSNVRPWAFGLSNRIIRETTAVRPYEQRPNNLLFNFRHNRHIHSVRRRAVKRMGDALKSIFTIDDRTDSMEVAPENEYHYLQWMQTGRRHYPAYYQRLVESSACACFGGFFVSPNPANQGLPLSKVLKRLISTLGVETNTVQQWDSWRFWESLAAGALTIHIDLEYYGCVLPVMPINWVHYVGVNFRTLDEDLERLASDPTLRQRIAQNGRIWVLENYSPTAVASRLLTTIAQK